MTDDEDGDTTVMVPAPVIDLLRKASANEDCSGRTAFVIHLPGWPGGPEELPFGSGKPRVQVEAVPARIAHFVVGTSDVPIEGHRHIEYGCRHGTSISMSETNVQFTA